MDEFHEYLSQHFDDIKPVDDIVCEQLCKESYFYSQIYNYDELNQEISVQDVEYIINKYNRDKLLYLNYILKHYIRKHIKEWSLKSLHLVLSKL